MAHIKEQVLSQYDMTLRNQPLFTSVAADALSPPQCATALTKAKQNITTLEKFMQQDTQSQLSKKTVSLHWFIAIVFISLLATGIYMEQNEVYALYGIHKSIGVLIFAFAIYRIIWRLKNGWLSTVGSPFPTAHNLAIFVHYLLIIGTVLMPISGFIMSAAGGFGVSVFGLELVAFNPSPSNPQEALALNESLAFVGHVMHSLGGKVLIVAVLLHIAGALKHHLVDKDGTLQRMLGKEI